MEKSIKCLLMDVDNVIISEVVEVDAQLGDPNCKMVNPYLFRSIDDMIPWPRATNQRELMIRSEDILTIADPTEEVKVGYELLKSLGLRRRGVTVISCPSCARQQFDVIKSVAEIEERLSHINKPITVSIIGCVVNGPGEAKETDIGLTGGGRGTHQIYLSGMADHRLKDNNIVEHVVNLVEERVTLLEKGKK